MPAKRKPVAVIVGIATFAAVTVVGWCVLFWLALATGITHVACGSPPEWLKEAPPELTHAGAWIALFSTPAAGVFVAARTYRWFLQRGGDTA
jgi:hypothetical protein